jgi:Patatin-like phospholipase
MPTPTPEGSAGEPLYFEDVFAAECQDIRTRRAYPAPAVSGIEPPRDLTGLALSGGGIRSATFCLGLLQHLAGSGLLRRFDYLSTVSGGGFVGGWWSVWLSRPERDRELVKEVFPPREGIEPDRTRWSPADGNLVRTKSLSRHVPDGSKSAGVDPVHHLRLFANYLTPRKGALSGDTWRAVTVISRNLFLTLLMLLPILAAAILAAQLYFVTDERLVTDFVCGRPPGYADAAPLTAGTEPDVCDVFAPAIADREWAAYVHTLQVRGARLLLPLIVLAVWTLVAVGFWMWFSTGRPLVAFLAFAGVALMLRFVRDQMARGSPSLLRSEIASDRWFLPSLVLGVVAISGFGLYLYVKRYLSDRSRDRGGSSAPNTEVVTNMMTRLQGALLVTLTVVSVVLLLGGFGHEAVRYLFWEAHTGGIARYVRRAGGWGALLLTLAGALYTALKAAPTGGGDSATSSSGRISTLAIRATPPLVLLTLMLGLATGTHALLGTLRLPPSTGIPPLHLAALVGVLLFVVFALFEFWTDTDTVSSPRVLLTLTALGLGVAAGLIPPGYDRKYAFAVVTLSAGLVVFPRLVLTPPIRLAGRRTLALGGVTLLVALAASRIPVTEAALGRGKPMLVRLAQAGLAFAVAFVLLVFFRLGSLNRRIVVLLAAAVVLLGGLYLEQFLNPQAPQVLFPSAVVAFMGVALAGVVGLGWSLDPNYLSLHTFYRARLVRAYLGASNDARRDKEITESADGDDLPLHQLRNCDRGGPYHLINTTLNLVAGRDLATAQRSAAEFMLSRHYCGSLRTGFRPTSKYMGGKLSLGTAVAASGAAASPNMGAKTASSALAMLLALLNVRLGFWAPTPNQARWLSPRPRLWPFYLLREFLSQTNDLSAYCYLTDGGHFDNTGLYSLVQRGCRTVLLVDCGADPEPCFSDVGDAIRRCRIDFGAHIELEVKRFSRSPGDRYSEHHYGIGKIVYDERHARQLGWHDVSQATRTGTVIWIKPSLLRGDPAEVIQYGLENQVFPQQTTADQWFDEAQFESYRRLGGACVKAALEDPEVELALAGTPAGT